MKGVLLALLVAGPAWAGAWSQPQGQYYASNSRPRVSCLAIPS